MFVGKTAAKQRTFYTKKSMEANSQLLNEYNTGMLLYN